MKINRLEATDLNAIVMMATGDKVSSYRPSGDREVVLCLGRLTIYMSPDQAREIERIIGDAVRLQSRVAAALAEAQVA